MSQPEWRAPTLKEKCVSNQECNTYDLDQAFVPSHSELNKEQMSKVANAAMEELIKLMTMNEPLWARSTCGAGYVLDREIHAKMFSRVDSLEGPHTREESSKHYKIVRIGARHLVEMLLDSEEWVNIFPTIVSKAETIKVLDIGSLDNRTGALQVVYEEMYDLSPLVPSRKLLLLRCCQQIGVGTWAIAHMSIDSFGERSPSFHARRLPSGCIIGQMLDETSMVTWVEHVEVNDGMLTSSERSVTRHNIAYGGERWLCALQRMCERFVHTSMDNMPLLSSQQVINSFNARKRAITLSDKMVQDFCGVMCKLRNRGFASSSVENNGEIKVDFRKNTIPGTPEGIIATAITTIRLPHNPQKIFCFLTEARKRSQWDVLSRGHPMDEIENFTIRGNRISIYKTIESNVMVFQDGYTDPLGSYVVYAPITVKNTRTIMNGEDSMVPILPSGFFITEDSDAVAEACNKQHADKKSGGSLLTMVYQLLMCSKSVPSRDQNGKTAIKVIVSSLEKIKAAL
ncbi:Homeobox-leucine zipper protein HDG1, partial [Mucuna pruriens]